MNIVLIAGILIGIALIGGVILTFHKVRRGRATERPRFSAGQRLGWIELGDAINVWHPKRGDLTLVVLGRVVHEELTQHQRGLQFPWVPTGNLFLGFRLEDSIELLNWQNRYYLLDSRTEVSDDDIRRNFATPARIFGDADQNARVEFRYPESTAWHIEDIGRFRIARIDGEWFPLDVGASCRFLHASGEGNQALVVEDFLSGGRDVTWTGYSIQEKDIRRF
jgi:hypothetical protein